MNLKQVWPKSLRRWRYVLSELDRGERRALLAAAIDAMLHPRRRDWRLPVRSATSVMFVCHGNIIRSPLAAAAFARETSSRGRSVQVTSAGLAVHPGDPADPRAIDSAEERGLRLESHRARPLDTAQVAEVEVIFVMDYLNLGRILKRFPAAADRVFLLGGCRPDGRVVLTEILDPARGTLAEVRVTHNAVVAATRLVASAFDLPLP